ncbi:hypothetical protein E2562_023015 [Oryza meyeriana var. granulata]|uniref:Uncharacterized protein n=1 Tax=Oryza meyeriana var. granulata TaxID=110450 RepID=A0A6G1EYL2_9ORYZ|nr:hypothetical protein E2562_023015 [Oryza meyeriana var. granulata]
MSVMTAMGMAKAAHVSRRPAMTMGGGAGIGRGHACPQVTAALGWRGGAWRRYGGLVPLFPSLRPLSDLMTAGGIGTEMSQRW